MLSRKATCSSVKLMRRNSPADIDQWLDHYIGDRKYWQVPKGFRRLSPTSVRSRCARRHPRTTKSAEPPHRTRRQVSEVEAEAWPSPNGASRRHMSSSRGGTDVSKQQVEEIAMSVG